jgi:hypothetical protein
MPTAVVAGGGVANCRVRQHRGHSLGGHRLRYLCTAKFDRLGRSCWCSKRTLTAFGDAVHLLVTSVAHNALMSSSDPALPSSDFPEETTVAAEPGSGGPRPQHEEEPDLPIGDPTDTTLEDALPETPPPFRTPTPGDRLAPEDIDTGTD